MRSVNCGPTLLGRPSEAGVGFRAWGTMTTAATPSHLDWHRTLVLLVIIEALHLSFEH